MDFYFAGGLFSHKEQIGNFLLAEAIRTRSHGLRRALLPQNGSEDSNEPLQVRDDDYALILQSDLALFNFDGDDVDSGTAAEFVAARMLDLPCVLLRTDFRPSGFSNADGVPWNLMMSGFPRTVSRWINTLPAFQRAAGDSDSFYSWLADEVLRMMDEACAAPPLIKSAEEALPVYRHWIHAVGGALPERFPEERLRAILEKKFSRIAPAS